MRHINQEDLRTAVKALDWKNRQKAHFNAIKGLTPDQRSQYFNANRDWNDFQKAMMSLYGLKCWYSEALIGAGDFQIDHFRPKNRSRQYDTTILKENGYWWLAYDWKNFRLSGGLCNLRRKDRLNSSEEVKGKGDYFPLDMKEGKLAPDCESYKCELPILLDPVDEYDVGLLSFDGNGEILPFGAGKEKERAKWSITLYHLDLEQLNRQRAEVWNDCKIYIEEGNEAYHNTQNEFQRRDAMRFFYRELRKRTDRKAPFSSVAVTCVRTYSALDDYKKLLANFTYN